MIPIKNKKKTLEMTVDEMRNFAFNYIEKFAPSKQQLKTYLLKKYLKYKIPSVKKSNITDLIDIVTEDLERSKFINDKFYSESKAKSLIQRGSSINKIRNGKIEVAKSPQTLDWGKNININQKGITPKLNHK